MERMKKFFMYFVMLLALILFVNILTNLAMKENYKDITNHQILVESPKVTVSESKATYSHGYIKGNILNDTGEHLKDKYLQFDFYDKDGLYVGTESKEIKYFNVDERINFEINFKYNNVSKIKINLIDNKKEQVNKEEIEDLFDNIKPNYTKEGIELGILISIPMVIWYMLPY